MQTNLQSLSGLVLRLGLVAVFAWFGANQLASPGEWLAWVPAWATGMSGLSATTIVYANGAFEILGAVFVLLGIYTRWVALLLAAHLFVIAFDIGMTAIGVRDFGLAMATLSLALAGADQWTVDQRGDRRKLPTI